MTDRLSRRRLLGCTLSAAVAATAVMPPGLALAAPPSAKRAAMTPDQALAASEGG